METEEREAFLEKEEKELGGADWETERDRLCWWGGVCGELGQLFSLLIQKNIENNDY